MYGRPQKYLKDQMCINISLFTLEKFKKCLSHASKNVYRSSDDGDSNKNDFSLPNV